MARARSNPSHNVASLKRALAEKEALLAEKEALLIERDRMIAVRDAELYAKTLQIEHLKAQLAVLRRARGSAAPPRSSTARSSSWSSSLGSLKRGWRRTANVRHGRSRMPSVASARTARIASRSAARRCLI